MLQREGAARFLHDGTVLWFDTALWKKWHNSLLDNWNQIWSILKLAPAIEEQLFYTIHLSLWKYDIFYKKT